MNALLKYRLKQMLLAVGYRSRMGGKRRKGLAEFLAFLRDRGFTPGTVVDVGVADGTFELYETFPRSFHLLVEPLAEFEPALKFICQRYDADYVIAAAGNQKTETSIYLSGDKHGASLMHEHGDHAPNAGNSRKVRSVRLDELVRERNCKPPFLVKVDVQGFEHFVIEGATELLPDTEAIILETALFRFKEDRPLLDETITFMKELGFLPYDIFGGYSRPLDGALAQIDVAFVKQAGRFRESNAFASTAQQERWAKSLRARLRGLLRT